MPKPKNQLPNFFQNSVLQLIFGNAPRDVTFFHFEPETRKKKDARTRSMSTGERLLSSWFPPFGASVPPVRSCAALCRVLLQDLVRGVVVYRLNRRRCLITVFPRQSPRRTSRRIRRSNRDAARGSFSRDSSGSSRNPGRPRYFQTRRGPRVSPTSRIRRFCRCRRSPGSCTATPWLQPFERTRSASSSRVHA